MQQKSRAARSLFATDKKTVVCGSLAASTALRKSYDDDGYPPILRTKDANTQRPISGIRASITHSVI